MLHQPSLATVGSETVEFGPSTFRWVVLVGFAIANMANAITWLTYAPIAKNAAKFYGVSVTAINLQSMLFMMVFIPVTPVSSWVLERYGIRVSVLFACALQAVGSAIRIAATGPSTFPFLVLGQLFCAVAQPFIANAPPKVSCVWFAEDQRALATGIATVANAVGAGLGFLLPPAFLGSGKNDFVMVHAGECAITVGTFLLCLFAIRTAPEKPTSPTSITGVEHFTFSHYFADARQILTDKNYFALFVCFGIGNGLFNFLGTVINQLLNPFGYSDDDTGNIGAMFIVFGVIGAGVASAIADYTKHHRLVLSGCFLLSGGALVWLRFSLIPNNFALLAVAVSIVGFIMTPTMPINIELAASYVYPVGEATAAGILMDAGQLLGIILILTLAPLLSDAEPCHNVIYGMAGGCVLASTAGMFFRGKLTRLLSERERSGTGAKLLNV